MAKETDTMKLYYFPRSSYSQKVLIALHEKLATFTPVIVDLPDAQARADYRATNPLGKVPLLVLDDGWKIPESTIIIEYLDAHLHTGIRLIPEDRDLARQTRFHDRLADLYVNDSMTTILFDGRKPEAQRNPEAVATARLRLDTVFTGLDAHLASRTWVMGDAFTMADCALAPSLAYCRTLHPFDRWKHLTAYAARVFERPSYLAVQAEVAQLAARTAA
jgi:glutathione S-transferase